MAKQTKTVYVCGECGYESSKWLGKCPTCGSWNTLVEESVISAPASSARGASALPLSDVESGGAKRSTTGIGELDRVLGGGIVAGSTVLLGGDPGIGKSTLLMQAASSLLSSGNVLYVTGEESAAQMKLRAERLKISGALLVLAETDLSAIEAELKRLRPDYLIIDSIQTVYSPERDSAPGSVTQVREVTASLVRIAKTTGTAVLIVGHVTKDGAIAGPRILEHMVDTVLYFEGGRNGPYRLLRAVKNRFGSTNEVGVFEMREDGMAEISDPSALFITGRRAPGCAVTCAMEGTRPMLLEVQSLLCPSPFNNPRRMCTGLDSNRLVLLLAVLERKAGLRLSDKDVYANVVGGIRMDERASDLAAAMCIASSAKDAPMPDRCAVIGEVSLTGDIRPADRLAQRVAECTRLGIKTVIVPASADISATDIELIRVETLADAVKLL